MTELLLNEPLGNRLSEAFALSDRAFPESFFRHIDAVNSPATVLFSCFEASVGRSVTYKRRADHSDLMAVVTPIETFNHRNEACSASPSRRRSYYPTTPLAREVRPWLLPAQPLSGVHSWLPLHFSKVFTLSSMPVRSASKKKFSIRRSGRLASLPRCPPI